MEINFEILFKLAQDKGYKLYFTALDYGVVVYSYKKEIFGVMEMWLIQKWLWESHRIFVSVSMDYSEKFFAEVNSKKVTNEAGQTLLEELAYESRDKYIVPELALNDGLIVGLRSLPDFKGVKTNQSSILSPDITNDYSQ